MEEEYSEVEEIKIEHQFAEYQKANTITFAVEHLATYYRVIKEATGYEISVDNYRIGISLSHALLHVYMGQYCSRGVIINAALFVFKTNDLFPKFENDIADRIVAGFTQFATGVVTYALFLGYANPVRRESKKIGEEVAIKIFALATMDLIHSVSGNKICGIFSSVAKIFAVPTEDALWSNILLKTGTFIIETVHDIKDCAEEEIHINSNQQLTGNFCVNQQDSP